MVEQDPLVREVNEAVRNDRYTALWNRYRTAVFAGLAALIVVTAGVSIQRELARQAASEYTQRIMEGTALLDTQKPEEAVEVFGTLADETSGEQNAIAIIWKAKAQQAAGTPAAADATLRNYVEQASPDTIWHSIACVHLLASESIPSACNGAEDGAFAPLLRAQTASKLAMNGEWEKADALLNLVMADEATPYNLQSEIARWQQVIAVQKAKASMAAMEQEEAK